MNVMCMVSRSVAICSQRNVKALQPSRFIGTFLWIYRDPINFSYFDMRYPFHRNLLFCHSNRSSRWVRGWRTIVAAVHGLVRRSLKVSEEPLERKSVFIFTTIAE